jgi:hypothetical protein
MLVAAVASGCATYRPASAREVREGSALVRVTGAQTGWVSVNVQGDVVDPAGSKVRAAWLTSADAARCAGGWPGTVAWQQGGGLGEAPADAVRTGPRRFELSFLRQDPADPLRGDSAVDLQLDTPAAGCLRVPFAGENPALHWSGAGRWYAGMALRYAIVAPGIGGAREALSLSVRVGRWVGPLRVTGEVGAGLHGCNGTCAGGDFEWLEGSLGLEGFIVRRDGWTLSLEAAYEALPGVGHPDSNQTLVHGPRLSVRLLRTERWHAGLPSGPEVRTSGLELFAGERFYSGAQVGGLVVGVGIVGDEGL